MRKLLLSLLLFLICFVIRAQERIPMGHTYPIQDANYRHVVKFNHPVLAAIYKIYNPRLDHPFIIVERLDKNEAAYYIDPPLKDSWIYYRIWIDYLSVIKTSFDSKSDLGRFNSYDYDWFNKYNTRALTISFSNDTYLTKQDYSSSYEWFPIDGVADRFNISLPLVYMQDYLYDFRLADVDHKYDFDNNKAFGVNRDIPYLICAYDIDSIEFVKVEIFR